MLIGIYWTLDFGPSLTSRSPLKNHYVCVIPISMNKAPGEPIGLIADSHGKNDLLQRAIQTVTKSGAKRLIHLGDLCDSLHPDSAQDTVNILQENNIPGVLGNNEYSIISEHHNEHVQNISTAVLDYLSALPYILDLSPFWFTHSAPFEWPAATRRPIMDFLPHLLKQKPFPFEILFRGHSHRPSVIEMDGAEIKKIPAQAGTRLKLHRNRRYVITVGAVEEASSALFLPEEYEIIFLSIGRI